MTATSIATSTAVPTSTTLPGTPTSTPAPTWTPASGGSGGSSQLSRSTSTATPTPTFSSTSVPAATSTATSLPGSGTAASAVPTDTSNQEIVLAVALSHLRQLTTPTPGMPSVQVPDPPVQVPGADDATDQNTAPGPLDGAFTFVQALFVDSSASLQTAQAIDPCSTPPDIEVVGLVDKSGAAVG